MPKRINPYLQLKERGKAWADAIKYRHETGMWKYPKDKLTESWRLDDLYERTKAAEQLGYEVICVATDDGLSIRYRKKLPPTPWEFT